MALLTGDFERLDPEHKAYMSDKFGVNLYEPFGPTNSDFDFFVTILITAVSDSDVEAYDIPVRAARTPGSTAKENQKSEAPIADQQPEQQAAIPTTSPVDLPLDTKRKPNTYEYELPPNDYLDLINRLSLGQLRGLKDIAHGALILRDEPQFDEDVEFLQEAERELAAEKSVSEIEANLREAYTDSASGELIDQLYAQYREALGVLGRNSMMNSLLVNAVVNVRRARKFGITGDTKAGDVDG
ncbi:MAG: hypothetical protein JWQ81_1704 [Amycolatopsis sp.]|jgi:hypothetical protein|nr:hypothetical protein [Amycolatopsis sp.]